jgi:pyridoxal phosphate enzyme (YggS family)
MIGHLQRNKARQVVECAGVVQSVDSVELAQELGKRAAARGDGRPRLRVLVEVSIAGEQQKGGVAPERLGEVLAAIEAEPALELRGLMCIPPLDASAAASRAPFDALARLRDELGGRERLPELSMGMSQDYEAAIAAGATCVRVGTAIFGQRPPRGA